MKTETEKRNGNGGWDCRRWWRWAVLGLLAPVAVIGVFSEPSPGLTGGQWAAAFIASKAAGVAAFAAVCLLTAKWGAAGKLPLPDDPDGEEKTETTDNR